MSSNVFPYLLQFLLFQALSQQGKRNRCFAPIWILEQISTVDLNKLRGDSETLSKNHANPDPFLLELWVLLAFAFEPERFVFHWDEIPHPHTEADLNPKVLISSVATRTGWHLWFWLLQLGAFPRWRFSLKLEQACIVRTEPKVARWDSAILPSSVQCMICPFIIPQQKPGQMGFWRVPGVLEGCEGSRGFSRYGCFSFPGRGCFFVPHGFVLFFFFLFFLLCLRVRLVGLPVGQICPGIGVPACFCFVSCFFPSSSSSSSFFPLSSCYYSCSCW